MSKDNFTENDYEQALIGLFKELGIFAFNKVKEVL